MEIKLLLSFIAIVITLLNTIIIVGKSHIDKNVCGYNGVIILTSLLVAIVWCIYGFVDNQKHIFIGYLLVILLLFYLLYLYYSV